MSGTVTASFSDAASRADGILSIMRNLTPFFMHRMTDPALRANVLAARTELHNADAALRRYTGKDMGDLREDYPNSHPAAPRSRDEALCLFADAREAVLNTLDAMQKCPPAQDDVRKALAWGLQGMMHNAVFLATELAEYLEPKSTYPAARGPVLTVIT